MKKLITNNIILISVISALALVYAISVHNKNTAIDEIDKIISSAPPASGNTNYYVCDTGDDENDGRSEATPFRTFSKAVDTFNKMFAGDSVLFCRGGVFPTTSKYKTIFNSKCGASNVCTMADYGDQTKERPYIFPQNVEAAFHLLDGGNADPDGGYVFRNLIIRSDKSTEFGFRMLNDVDDVVIDNMHIEGFRIGVYVGGVGPLNPGANNNNERITLKNSTIINNYGQGWLGGGDDHLIENNVFENNGSQAVFDHNIYLNSPIREVTVSNMTVRGNTLYKSTQVDGLCQGVSLVAHGKIDNLTIENNLIKEDKGAVKASCWGISVDPGYPTEEAFNNLVIRGNTLINVGNTGIGCASCSGVVIEDNDIIDESNTLRWGIRVPVRDEDSLKSDNVKITSNTVVLSHEQANGIYLGGENQFVAVSNTITQPSNTNAECIFKTGANSTTDTSSNTCSKHTDVTFIDNETGEPVDSTEAIIGSVLVDNETEAEAAPLRTEEPSTTESLAVVVESSNELTAEDYAKHEERIKAREQRSPRGSTDSSTTTTVEDVIQSTETTQSTTDVESCRAWSRGRCLMR